MVTPLKLHMEKKKSYSEKSLERKLVAEAKRLGARALKYFNPVATGYPDRLVCLPGGRVFWVELKSSGELPTSLQCVRITDLRDMGFKVFVVDSEEKLAEVVGYMESETA